jgi:hypothetical protein
MQKLKHKKKAGGDKVNKDLDEE